MAEEQSSAGFTRVDHQCDQGRERFRKLNVEETPLASRKSPVVSIPRVLIFKNGRIAAVSVGAVTENELRGRIDAALASRQ